MLILQHRSVQISQLSQKSSQIVARACENAQKQDRSNADITHHPWIWKRNYLHFHEFCYNFSTTIASAEPGLGLCCRI